MTNDEKIEALIKSTKNILGTNYHNETETYKNNAKSLAIKSLIDMVKLKKDDAIEIVEVTIKELVN